MWNKIVNFVFEKEITSNDIEVNSIIENNFLTKAWAHYCEDCDKFFKTKGARNAHNTLKHKNNE